MDHHDQRVVFLEEGMDDHEAFKGMGNHRLVLDELPRKKRMKFGMGTDYWKPALPPTYSRWNPREPEVQSQVSFWKVSSDESEDSIWGNQGVYWEPASPKPSPDSPISVGWKPPSEGSTTTTTSVWKWTPSPESEQGSGLWQWKPSPKEPVFNLNLNLSFSCLSTPDDPPGALIRRNRRYLANFFRKDYKFVHGKKTLLLSSGSTHHWTDECFATSWLAVQGTDSICMVTRLQDLDMTRVGLTYQLRYTNQQTLRNLAEAVISEVECLPYDRKDLGEKYGSLKEPFAVVSLIPGVDAETRHKDSAAADAADEKRERKAMKYLREKIASGSAFTYDETIQTAISAFQRLCSKKIKPLDIWVTVLNERGIRHLSREQKKEHLDIIRGVSRGCGINISSGVSQPASGCSTTDGSGRSTTDGSGPQLLNISEAFNKIALTYKRRPCPCGSQVCGGNGLNPCEAGRFKRPSPDGCGFKPCGDNAAECT